MINAYLLRFLRMTWVRLTHLSRKHVTMFSFNDTILFILSYTFPSTTYQFRYAVDKCNGFAVLVLTIQQQPLSPLRVDLAVVPFRCVTLSFIFRTRDKQEFSLFVPQSYVDEASFREDR